MYILISVAILIIGILTLPFILQINIKEKNTYFETELYIMLFGYILYQQKQSGDCLRLICKKLQKSSRNNTSPSNRVHSSEIIPILMHIGKWKKVIWYSEIGLDDASQTAIAAGTIQIVQGIFQQILLQRTGCSANIYCQLNFKDVVIRNRAMCIVGFRLGNIIKEIVKDYIKKKWRESI